MQMCSKQALKYSQAAYCGNVMESFLLEYVGISAGQLSLVLLLFGFTITKIIEQHVKYKYDRRRKSDAMSDKMPQLIASIDSIRDAIEGLSDELKNQRNRTDRLIESLAYENPNRLLRLLQDEDAR
jgi:hypothetical protein